MLLPANKIEDLDFLENLEVVERIVIALDHLDPLEKDSGILVFLEVVDPLTDQMRLDLGHDQQRFVIIELVDEVEFTIEE